MSATEDPDVIGEAEAHEIETNVQFENGAKFHYIMSSEMMASPVAKLKANILKVLNVDANPVNIAMTLVMAPTEDQESGQPGPENPMDDSKMVNQYLDEIFSCDVLKLAKRN